MSLNNIKETDTYKSLNTSNNNIQSKAHISNYNYNNNIYKAVSSRIDTDKVLTSEIFDKAVEEINKHIKIINRRFEYSIHEDTNKVMVRVFNSSTDEMIREIPPESRLDAIAKMWEMSGIIVDSLV